MYFNFDEKMPKKRLKYYDHKKVVEKRYVIQI